MRRAAGVPLVEDRAERLDDLEVRPLVRAADVVGLADAAALEDGDDAPRSGRHVQPVADLPPVAVDRQRLALQRVADHQRDQLLRELVGPVVVRAAGDERRQPVGVGQARTRGRRRPSRRRTGCSGRRAWLAECRVAGPEAAVDLVGRDVQEAEGARSHAVRAPPGGGAPPRAARACRGCWCRGTAPRRGWSGRRGSPPRSGRRLGAVLARGAATTRSPSRMSPRTKTWPGSASRSARFSRLPAYVSRSRFTSAQVALARQAARSCCQ